MSSKSSDQETVSRIKNDYILEEYRQKWEYVRHTEIMRYKEIMWYFIIVSAVLSYLFGYEVDKHLISQDRRWIPLVTLVIYSIFIDIRLIVQKSNYERYIKRVNVLEGRIIQEKSIKYRWLSNFKLIYYSIVLMGSAIIGLFMDAVQNNPYLPFLIGIVYFIIMSFLSFTDLIEPKSDEYEQI